MFAFIIISILAGLLYCAIPILILFEVYHWIMNQNEIKYPLLKGISYGIITGLAFVYLIPSGSGESGMIGNGMDIIVFPISIVFGIIIGCFYNSFKRTIFLKRKKHF